MPVAGDCLRRSWVTPGYCGGQVTLGCGRTDQPPAQPVDLNQKHMKYSIIILIDPRKDLMRPEQRHLPTMMSRREAVSAGGLVVAGAASLAPATAPAHGIIFGANRDTYPRLHQPLMPGREDMTAKWPPRHRCLEALRSA